jgi:hypothetical protein
MGRLFETASNGRARLMIEIIPGLPVMKQDPAYSFAADIPLSVKQEGVIF